MCQRQWDSVEIFGLIGAEPFLFSALVLLQMPLIFIWTVPTSLPPTTDYLCLPPAANVTVSLPVRGCVQDESCTRDGVTGPGFTLSGSCCQGSRCNSDLRNKTYFSPRIPPLVLLPPPTTRAPTTRAPTTRSQATSIPASTQAPTAPTSTTKSTPAPTSQTPPQEVQPEVFEEEGSRLAGGAAGHQDRSNMGQNPSKGGGQDASNKGAATLGAGLAALLLAVTVGALV